MHTLSTELRSDESNPKGKSLFIAPSLQMNITYNLRVLSYFERQPTEIDGNINF